METFFVRSLSRPEANGGGKFCKWMMCTYVLQRDGRDTIHVPRGDKLVWSGGVKSGGFSRWSLKFLSSTGFRYDPAAAIGLFSELAYMAVTSSTEGWLYRWRSCRPGFSRRKCRFAYNGDVIYFIVHIYFIYEQITKRRFNSVIYSKKFILNLIICCFIIIFN